MQEYSINVNEQIFCNINHDNDQWTYPKSYLNVTHNDHSDTDSVKGLDESDTDDDDTYESQDDLDSKNKETETESQNKNARHCYPETDVDNDTDTDTNTESEDSEHNQYSTENWLDKDRAIAARLTSKGYTHLHKLTCTDQGSVWRAQSPHGTEQQNVVIKVASKLHYEDRPEHEDIIKEISLLKRMQCHPSIIDVIDTIECAENYILILEDGGVDLFTFIARVHKDINNGKITVGEWQKSVAAIAQKLIALIHWLHTEMSVCHLDISLENVLISNVAWIRYPDQYKNYKKRLAPEFELKLIDFGAAQCFDVKADEFESESIIGKPSYCCPQIYKLRNKLTQTGFDARMADVWSYGACLFILSIGCQPWRFPDEREYFYRTIVLEQNLDNVLQCWDRSNFMTESMKNLLQKIFVIHEQNRISTKDIIETFKAL